MDFRYSVLVTLHKGCLAITGRYRDSITNEQKKKERKLPNLSVAYSAVSPDQFKFTFKEEGIDLFCC